MGTFFPDTHRDPLLASGALGSSNHSSGEQGKRESYGGLACLPEPQGGSQAGAVFHIEETDRYI